MLSGLGLEVLTAVAASSGTAHPARVRAAAAARAAAVRVIFMVCLLGALVGSVPVWQPGRRSGGRGARPAGARVSDSVAMRRAVAEAATRAGRWGTNPTARPHRQKSTQRW